MLNDRYDESLIILRRRFCWSYTDIFYHKQVVTRSANITSISKEMKQKLLTESRNLGDQLLYEKMREKWLKSPEIRQDDFQNEVSKFNFKFQCSYVRVGFSFGGGKGHLLF